ncbi:hypothetical protein P6N53_00900 [Desulforamulus aquiferis]|uniref:Uncharacterized protein n=2 Tax=Desulforamulus aquiferis TaxID=1397668 RepID=A0AAW7ZAB7_9FIRM|nr:hypothetical protein [Desulforamulus aquiferis]
MKIKKQKIFKLGILIILWAIVFSTILCTAIPKASMAEQDTSSSQVSDSGDSEDDEDGSGGGLSIGLISSLIEKIDAFIQTVQDLIPGKLLLKAIKSWIYSIIDDALQPVLGVFGRAFLFTPSVAGQEWVRSGWSTMFFFSLGLFALAVLISGVRIMSAKGLSDIAKPLKVLCGALLASISSLYLVEFFVSFFNFTLAGVVREYLMELGAKCSLLGNPESSVFDGNIILLATLIPPEQIASAVTQGHSVNYFLGAAGGILLSGFGSFFIAILSVIIGLRYLVLCLLAITAPGYFTGAALTGTWAPLAGWVNFYFRTLLLQLIFILGWIFMVAISDANETVGSPAAVVGVSSMLVNLIIIVVMDVVAIFIWVVPGAKAVMNPLTLNGGEFIEKAGDFGMRTSKLAHNVASRFGWDGVRESAYQAHKKAHNMRDFGRDLRNWNVNKPATTIDRQTFENPGIYEIEKPQIHGGRVAIQIPESIAPNLAGQIKASIPEIPEGAMSTRGSRIYISSEYAARAEEIVKEHCERLTPYWEVGNQYMIIQNNIPVRSPSPPLNGVNLGPWKK